MPVITLPYICSTGLLLFSEKISFAPKNTKKLSCSWWEKKIFVLAHSNKTINCCCTVITHIVAFHQPLVFSPAATLNRKHSLPLWMHNPRINNVFIVPKFCCYYYDYTHNKRQINSDWTPHSRTPHSSQYSCMFNAHSIGTWNGKASILSAFITWMSYNENTFILIIPTPVKKGVRISVFFPCEATCFLWQHKHPLDLKFPHRYDVQSIINLYTNIYSYILHCVMCICIDVVLYHIPGWLNGRGCSHLVTLHMPTEWKIEIVIIMMRKKFATTTLNSTRNSKQTVNTNNGSIVNAFLLLLFFFHWSTLYFSLRWS